MIKFILLIGVLFYFQLHSQTCEEWFLKGKIAPGKDCTLKCAALPTGMGNFECPSQCNRLCLSPSILNALLGKIVYYPGLTKREKDLVSKRPLDAFTVFVQKQKAESMTLSKFGRDAEGDESDAYRHFVWAALLNRELGPEAAKEFLDAHEDTGKPDDPSKAMDLANNRAGILAVDGLRRQKSDISDAAIEKSANEALNNNALIVLQPYKGPSQ